MSAAIARLTRALTVLSLSLWFVSTPAWLLGGCTRPGETRCADVCEHYIGLYLEAEWSDKLAQAASDDERAKLERDKAEMHRSLREDPEKGFETCVNRCNRRNRGEVADCVMKATDLAQAKKCDGDDSGCRVGADSRSGAPWFAVLAGLLAVLVVGRRVRVRPRTTAVGAETHGG